MRNGIWGFLQAESLEINADAPVWDDEVRVHGALHLARILTVVTFFKKKFFFKEHEFR